MFLIMVSLEIVVDDVCFAFKASSVDRLFANDFKKIEVNNSIDYGISADVLPQGVCFGLKASRVGEPVTNG